MVRSVLIPGARPKRGRVLSAIKERSEVTFDEDLNFFRHALLDWYDKHRRNLPWRESRDPYRIWLSEIMLQQTRVGAVLNHYRKFIERFPTIDVLAEASEDLVLASWSGLGYYRRARMLHRCAQQIIERGGCLPTDSESLLLLPGIGRYTAAAIASIAFGESIAVVDGNVERVAQRLNGIALTTRQTWAQAQRLLDTSRPGDFNQAMMELGATVCLPRDPRCPECPVRQWCATRGELLRVTSLRRRKKKKIWCALEYCDSEDNGEFHRKVRLVQRPMSISLMPAMWELPQLSKPPRASWARMHWRTFRHSITVTDYTVHVLRNKVLSTAPIRDNAQKAKWIAIDCLGHVPITGLTRKILKANGLI